MSALRAAVDVGARYGITSEGPVIVQETNNTVVWLRPYPVIAKVGVRPDSTQLLTREFDVARALVAVGAPVAEPLEDTVPTRDGSTGFQVTLWPRLDRREAPEPPGPVVADSLRQLHAGLAACSAELPDFRTAITRARRALAEDRLTPAMTVEDRAFLRAVFDALLAELEARTFSVIALHGEPHDGNRVLTQEGIRWIDLEGASRGPLEWDLAFQDESTCRSFEDVDRELLVVLSRINSARVATWCWVRAQYAEMRWHAEHHLGHLRRAWASGEIRV